jgi:2-isopropylmalate synthase
MIADSINYLRSKGIEVFYDAEHYFDGFKADKDYALLCLRAAIEAGATHLSSAIPMAALYPMR